MSDQFDNLFRQLTGHDPYVWQRQAYADFCRGIFDDWPLPTGVGKTQLMSCWLLSRAASPEMVPTRLIWAVNRRAVVDQATDLAWHLAGRVAAHPSLMAALGGLHVCPMRGQRAETDEWLLNPHQPAIIVGTLDLLGSRLLGRGYRCGRRARHVYAGLLGHDALLIHDEAHLEPVFDNLLNWLNTHTQNWRKLSCSATLGGAASRLPDTDKLSQAVQRVVGAKKSLVLANETGGLESSLVSESLDLLSKHSDESVIVFATSVEVTLNVARQLKARDIETACLVGTMRGKERDALADSSTFARFRPQGSGQAVLICTSAGEVGVDISGKHLVCDLVMWERMAQRFGRCNRYGESSSCEVRVVIEQKLKDDLIPTLDILRGLTDVGPESLETVPAAIREAASTPLPELPLLDDTLLDTWMATSIDDDHVPSVDNYIHAPDDAGPDTILAWRREVGLLDKPALVGGLKPHEILSDKTHRLAAALAKLPADATVWVIGARQAPISMLVADLLSDDLAYKTVLLPPGAGGLDHFGCFMAKQSNGDDIADEWKDETGRQVRCRVLSTETPPPGMRLVEEYPLDEDETDFFQLYRQPLPARRSSSAIVLLADHLADVASRASEITTDANVIRAAELHDVGKNRVHFQMAMGNTCGPPVAKRVKVGIQTRYRHEIGSMLDSYKSENAMVRHLIACHHGYGRPGWPADRLFDAPHHTLEEVKNAVLEQCRQFDVLARGNHYEMLYLEALLCAADWMASAGEEETT